jgi:hypothetical protein
MTSRSNIRALWVGVRGRTIIFPDRVRELSFLLTADYGTGLTNINNKTPGTGSGRFSLVEPVADAKSQSFRNPLTF